MQVREVCEAIHRKECLGIESVVLGDACQVAVFLHLEGKGDRQSHFRPPLQGNSTEREESACRLP